MGWCLIIIVVAPVAEQVLAKSLAAGRLEETGRNDLIGIDVLDIDRNDSGLNDIDGFAHFDLFKEPGSAPPFIRTLLHLLSLL